MILRNGFPLARALLFRLDPEQAHELTLRALEAGVYPRAKVADARLGLTVMGLRFPNPLGIAAGFDKDARVPDAVLGLGCGFAEVGTVTPRPQTGNPRPRVFRVVEADAIVNRLGFNNGGQAAALRRLDGRAARRGIVGVNIGANKDTVDKAVDYIAGLDAFYSHASYFMINVSSPNTPGLRDLQAPAALDDLIGRVMAARARHVDAGQPRVPIAVKIAPDIAEDDLAPVVERLVAHGVDAIAVSNTTLSRAGVAGMPRAAETGGLSGRPLFHRSTVMLARVYGLTGGRIPLIGIGGIDSGPAALTKIAAGASLLQFYTGLIYAGPDLITRITHALSEAVAAAPPGTGLADLVGRDAKAWSALGLEG